MLDFQPITEADMPKIAPFLKKNPSRLCDFTTVNLFVWAGRFYQAYAILDDMLFLKLEAYDGGAPLYAPPIGDGDFKQALCRLQQHAAESGMPFRLSLVGEDQLPLIADALGTQWRASASRDWCDYVYDAKAMAAYEGKAYAKQRNHLRRFERLYPSYRVEILSSHHRPSIESFLQSFAAQKDDLDDFAREELDVTACALSHQETVGLCGVVLYAEDRLVGFAAGCRSDDTLFVNFEKADIAFEGAYQMLVKAFAERYVDENIRYINREEDCGVPGLRRSKLAYHPVRLLGKFTLSF